MREPTEKQRQHSAAAQRGWTRRRQRAESRWDGYVEILPGVWQPAGMAAAERWKRQQRRRKQTPA